MTTCDPSDVQIDKDPHPIWKPFVERRPLGSWDAGA